MHPETWSKGKRTAMLAALCLCVVALVAGGVYAILTAKTDPVSNEFVPAAVSCAVEEVFTEGVKSDVKVRNTGNVDAYIRGAVVITFVAEDGKVLATTPEENVDYEIQWGAEGWVKGTDGYWYHTKPVKPSETTSVLIESAHQLLTAEGVRLHIQILATAVQAAPELAVQEAWGVSVSGGEIIPG